MMDKNADALFEVGQVVRYGGGETALMCIALVDAPAGVMPGRYYGEQYFGGTVSAALDKCELATDEEARRWYKEKAARMLRRGARGAADEVLREVQRATQKFPTWPTDPLHALAVLGEEFGELTKAMLQLTYEPHKTSPSEVREEAIQTAAMALRLIASLEQYDYVPSAQHSQGS